LSRAKSRDKKLIVILGPTATGKTKLAVKLASKFGGEIISADSRQVYCGMDIGTGKDLADYKLNKKFVHYYLIDVIKPTADFNVAKYQRLAYAAIDDVLRRAKLPLLVGGTGLYLDAVIRGYNFVDVIPTGATTGSGVEGSLSYLQRRDSSMRSFHSLSRNDIRKALDKLTLAQLLVRLKKIDLATYDKIDKKNRRRVQRALEIYYQTSKRKSETDKMSAPDYDILILGIKYPLEKIYQKIDSRLKTRLKEGLIEEIKKLHRQGVSWKRLDEFGLEYRYVSRYLRGLLSYEQMLEQLENAIHHFAKRQLTWFKRNKDIIWLNDYRSAEKLVKDFLL